QMGDPTTYFGDSGNGEYKAHLFRTDTGVHPDPDHPKALLGADGKPAGGADDKTDNFKVRNTSGVQGCNLTINCPSVVPQCTDPGQCYATIGSGTLGTATASGACGPISITNDGPVNGQFP